MQKPVNNAGRKRRYVKYCKKKCENKTRKRAQPIEWAKKKR